MLVIDGEDALARIRGGLFDEAENRDDVGGGDDDLRIVRRRIDEDRTLDVSRRENVANQTSKRQGDCVHEILLFTMWFRFWPGRVNPTPRLERHFPVSAF